ncbi:hypothetical protein AABM17_411 [Neisseria musculi]|uniref:Uncharacterized protein n=1 Tax=Neisseria musculi TaxID=1815583 RepID=A0A7H1M8M7_9NEIS|nr:hypothetical protein H7A79_0411 [Neisseria musculi]
MFFFPQVLPLLLSRRYLFRILGAGFGFLFPVLIKMESVIGNMLLVKGIYFIKNILRLMICL